MTTLEIILLSALGFVIALYITSKLGNDKKLNEIIKDVKHDLKQTAINVTELVVKAKSIIFDDTVKSTIKEFIMIVEDKNKIAKSKGEMYLSGDEKKKEVVSRLTEWVCNLTGSIDEAVNFIHNNQSKIEGVIDDYVSFSNKMEGKLSLSESEKLIQKELYK